MKKIGNANSVRIGTILLFMGSIIITFAESYNVMIIGQVLYTIAFLFKSMDNVMLKNNLTYLKKKDEYIKYKNKSCIIYSIVTTVVVLYAGYLFNINYYLPMYICILVCGINVIISFLLTDEKENLNKKEKTNDVNIQYQLNNYFGIALTATYFSYILVMSRISRVVSNLCFYKIYYKVKDRMCYYLPILCGIAFVAVIIGCFIVTLFIKFILMSIGFCMILGIRDIFNTYMQDLLLKKAKASEQQTGISYLNLSRKIGETTISFVFSLMLLKVKLFYIIVSLAVLSIICFMINLRLYKMVKNK